VAKLEKPYHDAKFHSSLHLAKMVNLYYMIVLCYAYS